MLNKVLSKILIVVALISSICCIPLFLLDGLSLNIRILIAITIVSTSVLLARYLLRDIREGLSALELGLLNLKDGEYATTLSYQNEDELGKLCSLYNSTALQLREEKHWIYQRELLLDKITQSSPEVLFLVNDQQQVIFSNIAARRFFNCSKGLDGNLLSHLLTTAPKGAEAAIAEKKEGLFSIVFDEDEPQTWHMSTGKFSLNNQEHTLFILKQMTRELSRQEVAVWKKVIRVISHELNNSLGPISSMLHSGGIISEKLNEDRLTRVFSTIDERIQHLSDFVQGYGKFAKLPEPKIQAIDWGHLTATLKSQWQFIDFSTEKQTVYADPVQLEQLLINLIKNAHESGSLPEDVSIRLEQRQNESCISVMDKGKGISENVMANALIPFYSTKASGSGLGLALCREITDAHHGNIGLFNREGGGLTVRVILPYQG
ncbi:ATP-binding protein [Psychrosphaera haliotis]|uniref:histidine kinase n=1 Tax=Psychrosphaera haliotis TaxID=555083 RepID=A0A6N8FA75_9GAMM|nr:ATP-binding protein [Psychrosphaera haliotis]MUH72379.1 histidine kinase [Psychrosphaera haliotis]